MISQKIRNNASIAYFFLGWLFLLAKNKPNFSDPFIKLHASIATKGHLFFFLSYIIYINFLSIFFTYSIPFLQISLDHCIQIILFLSLTIFIVHGAYSGQKDDPTTDDQGKPTHFFSFSKKLISLKGTSEQEKIIYILSHVPFLGMIIAKKYPNIITENGARISSFFAFFYILIFTNRGFDSLSMILLFVGVLYFVYISAYFFIKDTFAMPYVLEKIPKISFIYEIAQATPRYLFDIIHVIFGKKENLNFQNTLKESRTKNEHFQASLELYFTDKNISFSPIWIFVPFCNIIFIPKLFLHRHTQYVMAIGQGLIITLIAIILGYFYGFTSPIELFLLFPIVYGISELENNAFIRIPVIYEIYAILNTITFGILNNTKRIQGIQKQDTDVSYKLE